MKFRNKIKFRYGIPAYTGPFRALIHSRMYSNSNWEFEIFVPNVYHHQWLYSLRKDFDLLTPEVS
jgi:hypothetical protein